MPELPEWRYQTIIKPIIDHPQMHVALHGRILTCVGDEIIEDGYVEIESGKIKTVTTDKAKLSEGVRIFERCHMEKYRRRIHQFQYRLWCKYQRNKCIRLQQDRKKTSG